MNWNRALKGIGAWQAYRYLKNADWPSELKESMLDRLGLEQKSTAGTVFGGLGFFALGVLVGSALGVIFAPMPGSDIRATFKQQGMRGVMDKARTAAPAPTA